MTRPWARQDWLQRYAEKSAALKAPSGVGAEELGTAEKALERAFTTVYRAVAFDVDGTLTLPDSSEIDEEMAGIVGGLLLRGVPVVLVTGRGRSVRDAAMKIQQHNELSSWYMRRLYALIYNGIKMLNSSPEQDHLLSEETQISAVFEEVDDLAQRVQEALDKAGLGSGDVMLDKKEQSIRLVFSDEGMRSLAESALASIPAAFRDSSRLSLSRGAYEKSVCLDIGPAEKDQALRAFALHFGVPSEAILRLGDQGNSGGNDYSLLNCINAFSVDQWSNNLEHCHPVLDAQLSAALKGAAATHHLLSLVLLFPPLSLTEPAGERILPLLRVVEKAAMAEARLEWTSVTEEISKALASYVPASNGCVLPSKLDLGDLFDPLSGATRLREWEVNPAHAPKEALDLFGLRNLLDSEGEPHSERVMYSDSAILLRGPFYYFGLVSTDGPAQTRTFLAEITQFVDDCRQILPHLAGDQPTVLKYKLFLGILDNTRNCLLQTLFLMLQLEGRSGYSVTTRRIIQTTLGHTRLHTDALTSRGTTFAELNERYGEVLAEVRNALIDVEKVLDERDEQQRPIWIKDTFRIRECDYFLENLVAVRLGLRKLFDARDLAEAKSILGIGLVYGGIELPVLAESVGDNSVRACFAQVSLYSDPGAAENARSAPPGYVNALISESPPVLLPDDVGTLDGQKALLLDDNTTTCKTLQLTHDMLVSQGADVLGGLVVRYPGVNRRVQMAFEAHGFPDPEILLSFLRGLVSPSPFTRLMIKGDEEHGIYLDQSGVFDKSKERILRYLAKNGTPRAE